MKVGKVAVILDGLDKIPEGLRPVALRALSQQAVFRVVVLARRAEMAAAAQDEFLVGAVALELQDVEPATSANCSTSATWGAPRTSSTTFWTGFCPPPTCSDLGIHRSGTTFRPLSMLLHCLAAWMNQDGTRDLQWWGIRKWAPAAPRIIATVLAFGLAVGLTARVAVRARVQARTRACGRADVHEDVVSFPHVRSACPALAHPCPPHAVPRRCP